MGERVELELRACAERECEVGPLRMGCEVFADEAASITCDEGESVERNVLVIRRSEPVAPRTRMSTTESFSMIVGA